MQAPSVDLAELRRDIDRRSVGLQIAARLSAQIDAGLLQPGDELPGQRELAALFEVSRESLRGALQALQARGLIEIHQGRATRVAAGAMPSAEANISDLHPAAMFEARRSVEAMLTGLAATRIRAADLDLLGRMIEAQREMLADPVRFSISDREFHLAIHAAAGNALLSRYGVEVYSAGYSARRAVMRRPLGIPDAIMHHERIIAALATGSEAASHAAMAAHIRSIEAMAAS